VILPLTGLYSTMASEAPASASTSAIGLFGVQDVASSAQLKAVLNTYASKTLVTPRNTVHLVF